MNATNTELQNAILDVLSSVTENTESVSALLTKLSFKGWRGLGNHDKFISTCEQLGFSVLRIWKGGNVKSTWISV